MKFAAVWLFVTGVFLLTIAGTQTTRNVFDYWEIVIVWGVTCLTFGLIGVASVLWPDW